MPRLTAAALNKLQECILQIYSDLNSDTFHATVLAAIDKIIPSSSLGYAEINLAQKTLSNNVIRPLISFSPGEMTAYCEMYMHEHPIPHLVYPKGFEHSPFEKEINSFRASRYIANSNTLVGKAVRIHDILTKSQFRRLGIYNEFYRKLDIEYQIVVTLCSDPVLNKNLAINRDKIDFTEEERLLLNFLALHIPQAHKNAEAHEKARRAFSAVVRSNQSTKAYGLTYREEDVLYWVAQGKTNAETARILKIAPGTVKIHLEKIYQKLGVENRTSAAVLTRDLMSKKKGR